MQGDIQLAVDKLQAPEELKAAVLRLHQLHATSEADKKAAAATAAASQSGNAGDEAGSEEAAALQR
jgi:hypothetical protein